MSQTGTKKPGSPFPVQNFNQTPLKEGQSQVGKNLRGGKFFAHLLGLEKDDVAKGASATVKVSQQAPVSLKLSDFVSGIKLTPNFMFFLLFFGFFLWIFVIYWVRHNEPFANQVLGTPKGDPRKAAADRRIVAGIKNAFPVQTSASTGEIYVPGVPPVHQAQAAHTHQAPVYQPQAMPQGAFSQNAAPPMHAPQGDPGSSPFGSPGPAHYAVSPAMSHTGLNEPGMSHSIVAPHMSQAVHIGQGNYQVGVQSGNGTRVKTIVSR